jgi:hypothetical protein
VMLRCGGCRRRRCLAGDIAGIMCVRHNSLEKGDAALPMVMCARSGRISPNRAVAPSSRACCGA